MLFKIILTLISHFLSLQSAAVTLSDQPRPYEDADAYEVYSAILSSVGDAKTIVIENQTTKYEMCLHPESESKRIIGSAISEHIKMNEKPWLLRRRFNIGKPYKLIGANEPKNGDWEEYYKRYPNSGGLFALSAVGFNADKTVAVVYMGHYCGGLCGGGGYHVLQKRDGKWRPLKWKGSSCSWIS